MLRLIALTRHLTFDLPLVYANAFETMLASIDQASEVVEVITVDVVGQD